MVINPDQVGLEHDDGIYLILGKALSEGNGLRLINLPSSPHQAKYPPVYPFFISLIWNWVQFPQNIVWMKLINVAFLFLILLEAHFLSLILLDNARLWAVLITLLVGTSAGTLYISSNLLSEIPYLFFSLTAVLFSLQAEKQQTGGKACARKYVFYFLSVLSASLAFHTRTIGLSLLLALALRVVFSKSSLTITAFFLFSILVFNLPWVVWAKVYAPGPDINPLLHYYIAYTPSAVGLSSIFDIETLSATVPANLLYLFENVSAVISNSSVRLKPLMVVVWGILFLGVWKTLHDKRYPLIHLYLILYGLTFLYWPSLPLSRLRYFVPLAPFLFVIFFRGALAFNSQLAGCAQSRRLWLYSRALMCLLLFPNVPIGIRTTLELKSNPYWDGFKETISWIKLNTEKDAILACTYDPLYYLYTGRVGLRPWIVKETIYYRSSEKVGDPDYHFRLLKQLDVRYLIQEPLAAEEGRPLMQLISTMIKRHQDELALVFVSRDGIHRIYEIQYPQGRPSQDSAIQGNIQKEDGQRRLASQT